MVVDLDGVSFELTEKRISSLLEILPFEYRPSFDDEPTHQMVDPIQFPEFQRKISVKKVPCSYSLHIRDTNEPLRELHVETLYS
jgi:hypothetical protein